MAITKSVDDLLDAVLHDPELAQYVEEAQQQMDAETVAYRINELRDGGDLPYDELEDLVDKAQAAISPTRIGAAEVSVAFLRAVVAQLGGELKVTAIFDDDGRADPHELDITAVFIQDSPIGPDEPDITADAAHDRVLINA